MTGQGRRATWARRCLASVLGPVLPDGAEEIGTQVLFAGDYALRRSRNFAPVCISQGIGRYISEIEEAVYFCCLEALQNVAKHAGGGVEAKISIHEFPDRLEFEIRDEGQGLCGGAGTADGHGLTNMQERLAALGGTLEIESAPGRGTHIRGAVPRERG
jgi:signal transduction histidine kinase